MTHFGSCDFDLLWCFTVTVCGARWQASRVAGNEGARAESRIASNPSLPHPIKVRIYAYGPFSNSFNLTICNVGIHRTVGIAQCTVRQWFYSLLPQNHQWALGACQCTLRSRARTDCWAWTLICLSFQDAAFLPPSSNSPQTPWRASSKRK